MSLWALFKNIWPYVRPYSKIMVVALALTLVGSLTAQVNAWVLRYTVDEVGRLIAEGRSPSAGLGFFGVISAILIGKELLNIFIQFGQKHYGGWLRIYIARDLAQKVIEKILTFQMAFYSERDNEPGRLQTRIDRGVESLTRLVQNFFIDILPLLASSVVALIMMFQANFYVGLAAFLLMPVYYSVGRLQAVRLFQARRRIKSLRETKSQGILSILESIPVIKSFLRESLEGEKQMGLQTDLTDAQMDIRRISYIFDGLKSFIEQIGLVVIILLTTYFVLTGRMTLGAIMFHIMLFNNVSAPIRQLQRLYDQMNDALIYSEGFFDILKADHQVEVSGSYKSCPVRGHFQLEKVYFTYPGNLMPTLEDVTMEILPGKITALVGLSGAGKSTLINLLDKFYRPDSGQIIFDGVPLESYDTAFVRANIGLVLQKNHIFSGTVEENICYGSPRATRAEVEEAARQAFIHDQIAGLPLGYDTPALNLSGGQQQRLAIARMFLKNPPIIFLDEPTASLDAVATEQIKNSIDSIKRNRTVVIISHSISQIIDADQIHVMQNGRIVESGSHEELYRLNWAYHKIFEAIARSLNVDKIARSLADD